ncbi:MAG: response regulator [Cytophagales bacterium]|nr:response regulator [Cytophagales bacterium]
MKKVLIIDDEIDICLLLKAYLQRQNYLAEYECDLASGIKKLHSTAPDFVILDNNLPDGYGINHIGIIKEMYPQAKIIMISAMTSVQKQAMQNGADHFVKKPFKLQHISELIATQL